MMTAKKPLIALTAGNFPMADWGGTSFLERDAVLRQYSSAVATAGGLPVVLPLVRTQMDVPGDDENFNEPSTCGPAPLHRNAEIYVDRIDGLLLCGGGDLAPPAGAAPGDQEKCLNVDKSRDIWEAALLAAAMAQNKPVLGICRGVQVLNAALGGALWLDLPAERPSAISHAQQFSRMRGSHKVTIAPESRLAAIIKQKEILVNSGHHQGVKSPAAALIPSAHAEDGLIEALEHRDAEFIIGVQWHPEGQPLAPPTRALFAAFVSAAGK